MNRSILVSALFAVALAAQDPHAPAAPQQQAKGWVPPSTWIAQNQKEQPVPLGEATTVGIFEFANPTDAAVELKQLEPSCSCTHTIVRVGERTYRVSTKPLALNLVETTPDGEKTTKVDAIPVGPREHGTFELHMELSGAETTKIVTLIAHSTDPGAPMIQMSLKAVGQRVLLVEPETVELGLVPPRSRTPFTVKVRSALKRDFSILDESKLPPNVEATWSKETVDGAVVWTLQGTYVAAPKVGGKGAPTDDAILHFATDVPTEKSITVHISAKVGAPVEVTPTFLGLGQIRSGTRATASLRIARPDGAKITVTKVGYAELSIPEECVVATIREDGAAAIVEIAITEATRKGLARGDLVITTDHPTAPEVRVSFNGFVR